MFHPTLSGLGRLARMWAAVLATNIIAGSTEAAYAWITGAATGGDYLWRFFLPTLIGNLVGGTALAALLNHAPVAHDMAASAGD